ncbi:MAG TPA: YfhO family protein, partial [Candidatus Krumholzibacterium sp.]|nr:YfhO family protein [Candidatus Krumholzibacterium sp.]
PAAVTGRPDSSSVVITYYGAHRITMETFSTTSALLVLGEVYYPAGWKAAVDGQETGIFRTNAVLRSVVVPGGNHTVEFTFDPPTYELGSTITNFGWAAVVLLLLAGAYREPRIRRLVSGKGG